MIRIKLPHREKRWFYDLKSGRNFYARFRIKIKINNFENVFNFQESIYWIWSDIRKVTNFSENEWIAISLNIMWWYRIHNIKIGRIQNEKANMIRIKLWLLDDNKISSSNIKCEFASLIGWIIILHKLIYKILQA